MKRLWMSLLIVASVICLPVMTMAAPFMVCDPQAGVTFYKLTGPAWLPTNVPAQPDGSLKVDVGTALVGVNNTTVAACKTDAVWGEQCSSTTPFIFTRPATPTIPTGAKLVP